MFGKGWKKKTSFFNVLLGKIVEDMPVWLGTKSRENAKLEWRKWIFKIFEIISCIHDDEGMRELGKFTVKVR